jgi:DNA invertase Pin-like site-specific DNA recombinase
MCRVVDTVLIDQEAIYAPRQGNDRLLLGLKGSLNEYELDLLRQRSLSARHEKARRGELVVAAPVLREGGRPRMENGKTWPRPFYRIVQILRIYDAPSCAS